VGCAVPVDQPVLALEIRTVIDTTNAIESINMSLRKVTKTHAFFPSDGAVSKFFYLALNNLSKQ